MENGIECDESQDLIKFKCDAHENLTTGGHMMKGKPLLFAVVLAFAVVYPACLAEGAVIRGNVYNYDLTPASNVRMDINTSPHQVIVVKDGSYSVEVPKGTYLLQSKLYKRGIVVAQSNETINVKNEGIFNLDIILFPSIEELDEGLLDDVRVDVPEMDGKERMWRWYEIAILAVVVALFLLVVYYAQQARKLMREIKRDEKEGSVREPEKEREITVGATGEVESEVSADTGKETEEDGRARQEGMKNNYEEQILLLIKKSGGSITQKELRREIPLSEAKISLLVSALEAEGRIVKLKVGRGNILKLKR